MVSIESPLDIARDGSHHYLLPRTVVGRAADNYGRTKLLISLL
jgi:hypothetical protein